MGRKGAFSAGVAAAVAVSCGPSTESEQRPRRVFEGPSAFAAPRAGCRKLAYDCHCLAAPSQRRGWGWRRRPELEPYNGPPPPALETLERGSRARWCVNSSDWEPAGRETGKEFRFLLSLINEPMERLRVEKFWYWKDQRRALISRLMVRKACAVAMGLESFNEIVILRTKGRKPFLATPLPVEHLNFNFNISHEGDYVILASEPLCIVGVDVAAPREKRDDFEGGKAPDGFKDVEVSFRGSFKDFEDSYGRQLTQSELDDCDKAGVTMPEKYNHFMRIWACKEAVAKAFGAGILGEKDRHLGGQEGALDLTRVEFSGFSARQEDPSEPHMRLDGRTPHGAKSWKLHQEPLPGGHWLTVARGPPSCVQDERGQFLGSLRKTEFTATEWKEALAAKQPPFQMIPVAALVPDDMWEIYARIVGLG